MWTFFYLAIGTLETIGLLVYNLLQQSSPQERIWLGYSAERLVLIALVSLCTLFMLRQCLRALRMWKAGRNYLAEIIGDEARLWMVLLASLLGGTLIVILFILPPARFGDFRAVFENLKAVLLWLLALAELTFFFAFIWYCTHFMEKPQGEITPVEMREINWVLLIFALGLLVKILFVLPSGYGMLKDVGETKYLYMLQYFNEGIFLHSLTEFTTHYPPLYPLMLMFTFSLRGYAFEGMKLLNALMASSLVFPVYFLGRRFLDRKTSLALIVLCSLIPFQFLMPIRLLSENLYLPLLMGVIYLIFTRPADQRFRLAWDGLTGFALGLLYLTRYISLALIPFLLLLWWLKPFHGAQGYFHLYPPKLQHLALILAVTGLTYLPWVLTGLANGLPLTQMLGFGIAANTNPAQLTFANLVKWLLFYGAYYLLLAAPVLNLLLLKGKRSARDGEESRWKLLVGVLLLAFGLAIVRHSWRADYNLELPKRLMGRYVIYFVPLFLTSAFMAMRNFDRSRYRNLGAFLLRQAVLPLVLIYVSYEILIKGRFIPIKAEFLHPLISIDGYYLQLLGGWFFVLLAALFTGSGLLLWFGRRELTAFAALGLALFYLAGEPAYLDLMVKEQTPQQMGKLALDEMLEIGRTSADELEFEVLLPEELSKDERDDAAWSIFIRNPQAAWQVGGYSAEKIATLGEKAGILILPLAQGAQTGMGVTRTEIINGRTYSLQVILPQ